MFHLSPLRESPLSRGPIFSRSERRSIATEAVPDAALAPYCRRGCALLEVVPRVVAYVDVVHIQLGLYGHALMFLKVVVSLLRITMQPSRGWASGVRRVKDWNFGAYSDAECCERLRFRKEDLPSCAFA